MEQKKIPTLTGKVFANVIVATPNINVVILVPKVCSSGRHGNTVPSLTDSDGHADELLA